jgi:hypothetical protein
LIAGVEVGLEFFSILEGMGELGLGGGEFREVGGDAGAGGLELGLVVLDGQEVAVDAGVRGGELGFEIGLLVLELIEAVLELLDAGLRGVELCVEVVAGLVERGDCAVLIRGEGLGGIELFLEDGLPAALLFEQASGGGEVLCELIALAAEGIDLGLEIGAGLIELDLERAGEIAGGMELAIGLALAEGGVFEVAGGVIEAGLEGAF